MFERTRNTKSPRLNDFRKSRSVCYYHHNHGAAQTVHADFRRKLTGSYRDAAVGGRDRDRLQIVALMSIDQTYSVPQTVITSYPSTKVGYIPRLMLWACTRSHV
jgi:hypothetical protein